MNIRSSSFEQGPIRPPNEAGSLLLRFTRNCPWNHCLFCPVYKRDKFSLRSLEEIKNDIQTARDIADDIQKISEQFGENGSVDNNVISHIANNSGFSQCYRGVALWMYYGTNACFLQDADNMIMKTSELVGALNFLREKFPQLTRITTYSRSKTVSKKPIGSLKEICRAGLNRVHIGLETGYDPILQFMKKGTSGKVHIDAGRKLIEAGMEVSEYVMPGLGGQALWKEHALETARVINEINPHFIRLRSLRIPGRIPLHERVIDGSFVMQTDDQIAEEIRVFIEALDGINSFVASDHIMNLLEDVCGKLPEEKPSMLRAIESYQKLSEKNRLVYRMGRRGGAYRSVDDLDRDPHTYKKISNLIDEISAAEGKHGVEKYITEMVDQYI